MEAAIIVVVQVTPPQGLTQGIVKDEHEAQLPSPSSKTEAVD